MVGSRTRRWTVRGGIALCGVFVLVNAIACWHARALTRYAPAGERTAPPERLSTAAKVAVLVRGARVPRPENRRTPADVGLPFATRRVAGPRGALELWEVPSTAPASTVVAFPGYGASKEGLLAVAVELHALGVSSVLVDFAGAGGSEGATTTLGWREAEDVAAVVAELRARSFDPPLVLYGQSMGAAAVLRAVAELGVRADGLVLESPFDTLAHTVEHRFEAMGLPAFPGAPLLLFWGGRAAGFDPRRLAPADWARAVTCPVLVQWGAEDPRVLRAEVGAVVDALVGPARLSVFPAAGHGGLVANAERWRDDVAAFLAQLAKPR